MLILLKKHVEELTCLISVMMEDSNLPCFQKFDFNAFKAKFGETNTELEVKNTMIFVIKKKKNFFSFLIIFLKMDKDNESRRKTH